MKTVEINCPYCGHHLEYWTTRNHIECTKCKREIEVEPCAEVAAEPEAEVAEIIDGVVQTPLEEVNANEEAFILKSCPLCGGEAVFEKNYAGQGNDTTYYRVVCSSCFISTMDFFADTDSEGKALAMEAWNKRV